MERHTDRQKKGECVKKKRAAGDGRKMVRAEKWSLNKRKGT